MSYLTEVQADIRCWIEKNSDLLDDLRAVSSGQLEETIPKGLKLQSLLGEAGWIRAGWPKDMGGVEGSILNRAVMYDELARAGIAIPQTMEFIEIVGPMLVRYAPHIAQEELPLVFKGERAWCQGFSEPGAGSDLARLTTKAVADGDGYRITGQKIWTTYGHLAQRCGLLARTGDKDSAHRGLTMFWVDLDSPGVTVRTIEAANGRNEFCEVFYDDVYVDKSRIVGEVGGGWECAMFLLQFERGIYAWMRQATLHRELSHALELCRSKNSKKWEEELGAAYMVLTTLRARCWKTVEQLAEGIPVGPQASVDKLLLGASETQVMDVISKMLTDDFLLGDNAEAEALRDGWFLSRAATIYGGAAEIQRQIVADRLLMMPRG